MTFASSNPQPTPYPPVNAVLGELLSGVQAILGARFIGMYLYGSLALGAFDPQRSDIDFLVVTDGELPAETISALDAMHQGLANRGSQWAKKLEGAYLPRQALRRQNLNKSVYPQLNEGRFYLAPEGSDWVIQRHILREQGVIVSGPALATMIDPVLADDLRRAVRNLLSEWWAPMLDDPARLESSEYQAYAILTMCRALYTLHHGAIETKTVAARWAQTVLKGRWVSLVEWALTWQPGDQANRLSETKALIRDTIARAHRWV